MITNNFDTSKLFQFCVCVFVFVRIILRTSSMCSLIKYLFKSLTSFAHEILLLIEHQIPFPIELHGRESFNKHLQDFCGILKIISSKL